MYTNTKQKFSTLVSLATSPCLRCRRVSNGFAYNFTINYKIKKLVSWYCTNSRLNSSPTVMLSFEEKKARIQSYTKMEDHDSTIISYIIGNILGDGHLARRDLTTSLRFHSSEKHLLYIEHLQTVYKSLGYCSENKLVSKPTKIVNKTNQFGTVRLQTFYFIGLTPFHELFYRKPTYEEKLQNKKWVKIIPKNIDLYLTPLTLAIWFQDDGSIKQESRRISLCYKLFSLQRSGCFTSCTEESFFLDFYIYKTKVGKNGEQQWVFVLSHKQLDLFIKIVKPFMVPSMYYKLGLDLQGNSLFKETFKLKVLFEKPELFNEKFLADWVSFCCSFKKADKTVKFSTQESNLQEVELLQTLFKQKFNLHLKIRKNNVSKKGAVLRVLHLSRVQMPALITIVKPFMLSENLYKLGINS